MIMGEAIYDYVIIGSGFGGSVSALRLAEKGYSVLILERGKRFEDRDFPKTNWNIWKSLWLPIMRCFGTWEMTFMNGVIALHGSGVGGGSLMYANVLVEPDARLFEASSWHHLADWRQVLRPHYQTAKKMLGVTTNPRLTPADLTLQELQNSGKRIVFTPPRLVYFLVQKMQRFPIHILAVAVQTGLGVISVGDAWSAAGITQKIHFLKITSFSLKSSVSGYFPR